MKDKFRVGTKVRVVKAPSHPHLVGNTYVVKGPRVLRQGKTRKWWGYDIGLQIEGTRVYPRQQALARVFSSPAPGLQRISELAGRLSK